MIFHEDTYPFASKAISENDESGKMENTPGWIFDKNLGDFGPDSHPACAQHSSNSSAPCVEESGPASCSSARPSSSQVLSPSNDGPHNSIQPSATTQQPLRSTASPHTRPNSRTQFQSKPRSPVDPRDILGLGGVIHLGQPL